MADILNSEHFVLRVTDMDATVNSYSVVVLVFDLIHVKLIKMRVSLGGSKTVPQHCVSLTLSCTVYSDHMLLHKDESHKLVFLII